MVLAGVEAQKHELDDGSRTFLRLDPQKHIRVGLLSPLPVDYEADGCGGPTVGHRHVLCLAIFVGSFFQYLQRSAMVAAVVGHNSIAAEFQWTNADKGLVLSGFFYGYSLGQIPAGWASAKWGGRALFFTLGLATVLNMLMPYAASLGVSIAFASRICFGAAQSPLWPTVMGLLARWARPGERSRLLAWSSSSMAVAYFTGISLTTFLIEEIGWRAVFTAYGTVALLWVPMWHRHGWSRPEEHPRICKAELESILSSQLAASPAAEATGQVPWAAIFSSKAVWSCILADSVLGSFANAMFFAFMPTYMHHQLGLSIRSAGFCSACPQLAAFALQLFVAPLADNLVRAGVELTHVRKLFSVGPALLATSCSLCLGVCTPGVGLSVALITTVTSMQGLSISGGSAAIMDMTREYAGVIAGVSTMVWALVSGLSSTVVGFLLDHGHCPGEGLPTVADAADAAACANAWRTAFCLAAALFFAQGSVFGILGSSRPLELPEAVPMESPKSPVPGSVSCDDA